MMQPADLKRCTHFCAARRAQYVLVQTGRSTSFPTTTQSSRHAGEAVSITGDVKWKPSSYQALSLTKASTSGLTHER
jgi:hypothetical protein